MVKLKHDNVIITQQFILLRMVVLKFKIVDTI